MFSLPPNPLNCGYLGPLETYGTERDKDPYNLNEKTSLEDPMDVKGVLHFTEIGYEKTWQIRENNQWRFSSEIEARRVMNCSMACFFRPALEVHTERRVLSFFNNYPLSIIQS